MKVVWTGFWAQPGVVLGLVFAGLAAGLGDDDGLDAPEALLTVGDELFALAEPWNIPSRYWPDEFFDRSEKAQSGCFSYVVGFKPLLTTSEEELEACVEGLGELL